MHYKRKKRSGLFGGKLCKIHGCENYVEEKGLCVKHSTQLKNHRKILSRTMFDRNEIIHHKDYAELCLYKNCVCKYKCKIDLCDVESVSRHKWRRLSTREVFSDTGGYLNRYLLGTSEKNIVVKNRGLDYRREKIKVLSKSESCSKSKISIKNTSGYKGVHKRKGKKIRVWSAYINKSYKRIHLGYFETFEKAVNARKRAEKYGQ